jgi:hypothetical protein
VHQTTAVRVVEPPRGLDRDVQNPCQHLGWLTVVQAPAADPLVQAAARHVLGEHPRHAVEHPHVVAAAYVRMQSQRHPRLRLGDEPFAILAVAEQVRTRALHRQIGVPVQMPHPVHHTHPALLVHAGYLIPVVDDLTDPPHRRHYGSSQAYARYAVQVETGRERPFGILATRRRFSCSHFPAFTSIARTLISYRRIPQ